MNNSTVKSNAETPMSFSLDYKKLIREVMHFWWLFVITIPLSLGFVYAIHRYITPIYSASMRVLMEERGNDMPQTDMMEGFGLTPGMRNIDNQLGVLSSWDMIYKAVEALDFDVSYFAKGKIKTTEIYPATNYKVEFDTLHPQLIHTPFYITQINDHSFELRYQGGGQGAYNYLTRVTSRGADNKEYIETYQFGEWITKPWLRFRVVSSGGRLSNEMINFFEFNHPNTLTAQYVASLKASKTNNSTTIIRLSVTGAHRTKNVKFLNTLVDVFIELNLEKKNKIATNTINFIESQLMNISDSLSNTGSELSNFRTENRIQSVSAKADYLFEKLQNAEEKKVELIISRNYYNYLSDYFQNDIFDNKVIAPAVYQTDNQLLTLQIQRVMELNTDRLALSVSSGESKNLYVEQKDTELKIAVDVLLRSIESQRNILDKELKRLESERTQFETELYSLPETERKLLGIERKFQLNNEVYTFLLRKRSEAQIQKASNTPDHQVLEAARSGAMVSPDISGNYKKAFMLGLFFPLLFLVVKQLFNNKVTSLDDVEKITNLPIVGQILHSTIKESNVVRNHPKSVVTEAFRRARTRLDFMIGDQSTPIITISSSIPGEGKTFCALNLASVFALTDKKTILISFDMRKSGLNKILNLNDCDGLSDYLIGHRNLNDIIYPAPSGLDNLFIIPSGPLPPNPSELIASAKTSQLFDELKAEFDLIILDSPPMVVADPYLLSKYSDTMLFVVRHNYSIRNMLAHTIRDLKSEGISHVGILLNDLNVKQGRYGTYYGYGYGHGYYEES